MSEVMWGTIAHELAYQPDDLPALAALTIPILVLVGDQDAPFVLASALIKDAIPDCELATIPNAGHSPQFENPEATTLDYAQAREVFGKPLSKFQVKRHKAVDMLQARSSFAGWRALPRRGPPTATKRAR